MSKKDTPTKKTTAKRNKRGDDLPQFPKKRQVNAHDWMNEEYGSVRGEMSLWTAVIMQALIDSQSKQRTSEALYHKEEAIRWLTRRNKDFNAVCLMAGYEPDYIRQKAKRALASPVPWRAEPGKGKRYVERKAAREKLKREETASSEPEKQAECNVIAGPWRP